MEDKHNQEVKKKDWPATLYVEGQDQFRGWFNSSLITSVILANQAPYQQVLSHGFVVDEKGHKMSKSLGNVIDPEDIIEKFGADILRSWVISSDFTKEVKISIPILENLQESYQKIRNTCRFLLGNLTNLPSELCSENDLEKELESVDYYILSRLESLLKESQLKYNEYNFNNIYSSLLNFCINDLSSFYFEISKDSLYCDSFSSRRRTQIITILYYLLAGLLKIVAPILPYLAEEVYQNIPFHFGFAKQKSVYLSDLSCNFSFLNPYQEKIKSITDFLLPLRQDIFPVLEKSRQEKIIATNSQAVLTIYLKEKVQKRFPELNLKDLLLVSEVKFCHEKKNNMKEGDFCFIKVENTNKKKCIRCWNYRELNENICSRCQEFLNT